MLSIMAQLANASEQITAYAAIYSPMDLPVAIAAITSLRTHIEHRIGKLDGADPVKRARALSEGMAPREPGIIRPVGDDSISEDPWGEGRIA